MVPITNLNEVVLGLDGTSCDIKSHIPGDYLDEHSFNSTYLSESRISYSNNAKGYSFENVTFTLNPYRK